MSRGDRDTPGDFKLVTTEQSPDDTPGDFKLVTTREPNPDK